MPARFSRQRARGGHSPDQQAPPSPLPRRHRPLDVTVTILTTADASSSRSFFGRKSSSVEGRGSATTTVVASFANSSGDVETAFYAQRSVLSRLAPGLAPQSLRDLV
mmetsp:Transcript_20110/g.47281  ORF Transcript_20110/g.47281 Transcript_20110/m.47281 type:complete len:107 (-) Transcript_20110:259-579(-)